MEDNKLHPLLIINGICLVVIGILFPFTVLIVRFKFLWIIEVLVMIGYFVTYNLYIAGDERDERKAEIKRLSKENTFMRNCTRCIFAGAVLYLLLRIVSLFG